MDDFGIRPPCYYPAGQRDALLQIGCVTLRPLLQTDECVSLHFDLVSNGTLQQHAYVCVPVGEGGRSV